MLHFGLERGFKVAHGATASHLASLLALWTPCCASALAPERRSNRVDRRVPAVEEPLPHRGFVVVVDDVVDVPINVPFARYGMDGWL